MKGINDCLQIGNDVRFKDQIGMIASNSQLKFHEMALDSSNISKLHTFRNATQHEIWKSSVQNQRYRINEVRQRRNCFVGRANPVKG